MNHLLKAKLAILGLILLPMAAAGHETKRSGTLEVLLHRDPEESPIAREPSRLYFSVTDSGGKFDFSDCDCRVAVNLGAESLLDRPLAAADEAPDWGEQVARVDFTYPRLGIYQATIQGRSKTGKFNDFKLAYDVRVDRDSANVPVPAAPPESAGISKTLRNYYSIGGAVVVIGIMTNELIIRRKKQKT